MANSCLLLLVPILGLLRLIERRQQHQPPRSHPAAVGAPRRRLLKPRTPDDGPQCRRERPSPVVEIRIRPPLRPWSDVRRRRGAPKPIATQGFTRDDRTGVYFAVPDAHLPAPVGDGLRGTCERIRTLRCQVCGHTFSARRNTALYRLTTASRRITEVLAALAEGLDVSAAVRVFGHGEATITRGRRRAGRHGGTLRHRSSQIRPLPHPQLDEIRTRLRWRDPALRLRLSFDPVSKLIPALHRGPRTPEAAHAVIHQLHARLSSDRLPVSTSDALSAHFGSRIPAVGRRRPQWRVAAELIYGQVKEVYRRRKLVRVRCPTLLRTRDELTGALPGLGLSGKLTTAFVERVDPAIRRGGACQAYPVDGTEEPVLVSTPGVVGSLLPLLASARVAASGAGGAQGTRRPASAAEVSPANPGAGGGTYHPTRGRERAPGAADGAGAGSGCLKTGGREPDCQSQAS